MRGGLVKRPAVELVPAARQGVLHVLHQGFLNGRNVVAEVARRKLPKQILSVRDRALAVQRGFKAVLPHNRPRAVPVNLVPVHLAFVDEIFLALWWGVGNEVVFHAILQIREAPRLEPELFLRLHLREFVLVRMRTAVYFSVGYFRHGEGNPGRPGITRKRTRFKGVERRKRDVFRRARVFGVSRFIEVFVVFVTRFNFTRRVSQRGDVHQGFGVEPVVSGG
mmetsp:Transcript_2737/g.10475  ORF Transcript_2737/g.10475 Transcript_2737/m.10475 type:complete len:222 (-) Transcript_2737:461-1126(-)